MYKKNCRTYLTKTKDLLDIETFVGFGVPVVGVCGLDGIGNAVPGVPGGKRDSPIVDEATDDGVNGPRLSIGGPLFVNEQKPLSILFFFIFFSNFYFRLNLRR